MGQFVPSIVVKDAILGWKTCIVLGKLYKLKDIGIYMSIDGKKRVEGKGRRD